jgi:hypothetical protein
MWAGIAGVILENKKFEIAISIHDSVYSTDFASAQIDYDPNSPDKNAKNIESFVLEMLRKFSIDHLCKFLGAGVTLTLLREVGFRLQSSYQILSHIPNSDTQYLYQALA